MEGLGAFIRQQRDKKDISLREFAKRLGCSAAFLSDVELGRRHPSGQVLGNIARLLDTTVEKLRSHDIRPPLEEIKRITETDPRFALAFRTVIDSKISAEELLELAQRKEGRRSRKR